MPDVTSPYPLRRGGPKRHRGGRRLRGLTIGRAVAMAILVIVTVAVLVTGRSADGDPRQSLANARAALALGNYTGARDRALAAVKAEPGSKSAQWILARAYLELGDGSAADAVLTRAQLAGVALSRIRPFRAAVRLLQGDINSALALSVGVQGPDAIFARRVHARATWTAGDAAGAQRELSSLSDGGALTDLARIRLAVGDIGGAAEAAGRALAADPRNPATLTVQGEIVQCRYGLAAALPWFEAALKRDAGYPQALADYAATLAEVGRYADALAAARRALAQRPGMPQALFTMAVIAVRAGDADLAKTIVQRADQSLDTLPANLLLGGALDAMQGHGELAVAQWRRLLDVQPDNRVVRSLLAAGLLQSGDPQGALDAVAPVARRGDADSYALELAARAAWLIGDRTAWAQLHDRAISAGRAAAGVIVPGVSVATLNVDAAGQSGDPAAALALIRGLVASGDVRTATDRAAALAAALPGTAAAQLVLGDTLVAGGRFADAAMIYARAANLTFDEPTMLKLVDALGRAGRNGDAAQALALYAAQDPQSAVALGIAGHWQVAAGEFGGAIVTLQRARALIGSRNAAVLTDLALAYAGIGKGEVARRYGRAAYALAPMNVAAVEAYAAALHAAGDADGERQLRAKLSALLAR
jgi:tetratricopeptide (TPR) repeat protein